VYEGLKILEDIPHADLVEERLNDKLDQLSNEVDVVVYPEFGSDEALLQFKVHPLYQESIERVGTIVNYDWWPTPALNASYSRVIHTGQ